MHLWHLEDLIAFESRLCQRANCANVRWTGRFFAVISRLGDGVFWYSLMLALPLLTGRWDIGAVMAITGAAATWTYKLVKSGTKRERPCQSHAMPHLTVAPLDRFSFPSGHTLHAVCFTILACSAFPTLAWLLVPFTLLVAASRVILGLHYPSDVLVGALTGAGMAWAGLTLSSAMGVVW